MWIWLWHTRMENDRQLIGTSNIRNAGVAYEIRDLSHVAIFYFFLALGVVIVFVFLALWGVFRQLGSDQYAGHQTTNPIMTSDEQLKEIGGDPANRFPMPHLQADPIADLNKFRIREEQRLNTYGWVDQTQGRIHIPIEKAIDIMAASWPSQEEKIAGSAPESSPQAAKSGSSAMQSERPITDDRGGNYGW
jgi:hypothetical protein